MKIKTSIFILAAVLIMGICVISPVSAYTLLSQYTLPADNGDGANEADYLTPDSAYTYLNNGNITYWEVDYPGANGASTSGTYDAKLSKLSGSWTDYADIHITWHTHYVSVGRYDYHITYALSNKSGTIPTGSRIVKPSDHTWWETAAGTGVIHYVDTASACPTGANQLCLGGPTYQSGGDYRIYGGSAVVTPEASFLCAPTSQFPNANVVCNDTSTNTPTDWLWTIDAEAMGIKGWQTSTSRNFTWQSAYAGLYSVNLRANNSAGSDWENKTNYVSISANATPNNCNLPVASGYVRTVFECLNSQDSSAVSGCDIQLRDNEAGAWSNATGRSDGLWCIDTYPEHTINGYAQASGYTSASSLNLHALSLSEGMYYLLLIPGYVPAAPDGKVYLYVTVNDYDNSQMIPSAYITASWSGGGYAAATTSAAGTAILTVKNSTSIYITATKSGYVSVNRVISTTPFGPDSTTIGLHRMVVSPTATATTGPGGTVAPTVNPYGTTLPSGVMPAGYTNNQGQIMMDFLAANGLGLVQLCFLVTICALLGIKFGK